MNRLVILISALVISSLSSAANGAAAEAAGTYVLKLSDESVALCRLIQAPIPVSTVVLSEDSHYMLERNVAGQVYRNEGAFTIERGVLILFGKRVNKGAFRKDSITLDGLVYERQPTCDLVGTWVVRQSNGVTDTASKMTFTDKGTFRYKGLGGTSSGKFELDGDVILLTYTEVDGARVDRPFVGRAFRAGEGFRIDRYRFVRA